MQSTIQYIKNELAGLYPKSEIDGFTRLIFESVCGLGFTEFLLQKENKIDESSFFKIQKIVQRLKSFEPLQYILGKTEFYGLSLKVTPAVLIPRPETEELVHLVVQTNIKEDARIIDIGTGSVCIALSVKSTKKNAAVSATDISPLALEIASENARRNSLYIHFFESDILNWQNHEWENYDVIISNPPYVRESEKKWMASNVLNFEPHQALFVEDANPLKFYQRITEFARQNLSKYGWLFFEINEVFGTEVLKIMYENGIDNVEVKNDLKNKPRMVFGHILKSG